MKEVQRKLQEALHLTRKHAIHTKRVGKAALAKCMECGANGADHPDGIEHEKDCRLALLLVDVGMAAKVKANKKMVEAPDLDACTS